MVVYGARPQIDANLAEHHHEPVYHKQTRVTDAKTLELVKQAAGMLQLEITARLSMSLNNTPLQGPISTSSAATLSLPSRWASMTASIIATADVFAALTKRRFIVSSTAAPLS